jgi:hypothetical protein
MSTFWKSLSEVAKGQLFIGGHLSPTVVAEIAAKHSNDTATCKRNSSRGKSLPWPRLAIPH